MQEVWSSMKKFLFIKGVCQPLTSMTQEKFDLIMDFSIDNEEVIDLINKYPKFADTYVDNILRMVEIAGVPGLTPEISESILQGLWEMIKKNR